MKRTIDEKLKYNREQKTPFASGYCVGAILYNDYRKTDDEGKTITRKLIDTSKSIALSDDDFGKGFMCGVRDAANERKARKKK